MEPLTIRKTTHDLAILIAQNVHAAQLSEEEETYFLSNKQEVVPALRRGFITRNLEERQRHSALVAPGIYHADEPVANDEKPPDLSKTGPTFGDWLTAREELHKFLTGETIMLRSRFQIPVKILIRTDIMPFFRPAGATNRMALEWKKKLGVSVREEEDVMRYTNSDGSKVHQLGFITRSTRPDVNTLGENKKSPINLRKVKMEELHAWLNLFGYADADNLHFLITKEHLDNEETLTWFPDDILLPSREVGCGHWHSGRQQVKFRWHDAEHCNPYFGARLVEFFELRT